jgi:GxxExxY protein
MSENNENKKVVFPELRYNIVGTAFEVYNELGSGFPGKYYPKALSIVLKTKGLVFKEQVKFPPKFKDELVGKNYFDF